MMTSIIRLMFIIVVHEIRNRNTEHLVISPHAMLKLMPYGSSELDGKRYSVGVGGHSMSVTKRAAQKCSFSGNRAGEEHQMRKCLVDNFNGQTANMGLRPYGQWDLWQHFPLE